MAEKGIDANVELIEVDINKQENREAPFLKLNPLGWLPVLELDDGTTISESMAICRYFEVLHPEPNLFGQSAIEVARIEQWNRHMEFEILAPCTETFRNTHKFWADKIEQAPAFGEISRKRAVAAFDLLDDVLGSREWIAGDEFSIADISGLAGIDFGRISKIRIGDGRPNLACWYKQVNARFDSTL